MTTVLFVGDSITVGLVGVAQGKTNGAAFRGPAGAALGWRAVGPFKDPTGLLHGGVGGATTYTFDEKAQFVVDSGGRGGDEAADSWVLRYQPDVIHLMLGVNDILSFNEPPLDLYTRLMGLAGAAVGQQRRTGKHGFVLLSTICESLMPKQIVKARALNYLILQTNEIGKDYQIRGVDSAGLFNTQIAKEGVTKYTVDGTHPNQLGYDLIARSLVDAVQRRSGVAAPSGSTGARVVAAGGIAVAGWGLGKFLKWW